MPITQETIENIKNFKDPLLRKRYAYLWQHPQIKEMFFAVETADKILEIAQKYHLQTEKMQCLAKTAGLVLLGEIRLEDFEQEIQKQCGFIPESSRDISQDVYQNIFKPIEQYLVKPSQPASLPKEPKRDTIKQELAEHGIEIKSSQKENWEQDKYREEIT